jgi:hypothetical protein
MCGSNPKCLIVDGTCITINEKHFLGHSITNQVNGGDVVPRQHTRNGRAFFNDDYNNRTGLQRELKNFSKSVLAVDDLTVDRYPNLHQFGNEYGLHGFLVWIIVQVRSGSINFSKKKDLVDFLDRNLATDSPVLSYVPRRVALKLREDLESHGGVLQMETMECIVEYAPCLLKMLMAAGASHSGPFTPPEAYKPLLKTLYQRSVTCTEGPGIDSVPRINESEERRMHPLVTSPQCISLGICSGLPQLRDRPRFAMDDINSGNASDEERVCNKNFQTGGARTGGLMTVFCEHGVCYATFIMKKSESRDHLFSFMVKFLETPPKVLVYDFGCAVMDYCLNRLPNWFKDMVVLVDKFHYENHKACSSSFNMRQFEDLKLLNSQIAEQCNAKLRRINPTLHKSSQPFFMAILRQYLSAWNKGKNEKLRQALARNQRYEGTGGGWVGGPHATSG